MRPLELTAALAAFERRGPGTDAERRAARWLAGELSGGGRRPAIETFWCRPNWALAHAWHVALALAGSLLSVSHPTLGAGLLVVALLSVVADATIGVSPGRRLTPERASQNVLLSLPGRASPIAPPSGPPAKPTTLILTANYDIGRAALVYRGPLRSTTAALSRALGPLALGWLGWLSIAIAWLLAIALIRIGSHNASSVLGAIQLPPSVGLVLTLALLLDAAGARHGPPGPDNASGVAVAVAIARTLSTAPPRHLAVELVLQGAGAGHEIGMRRYLKRHARNIGPGRTIVLGIAPSGAGEPHWWRSDGRLIPIGYTRRLGELARTAAGDRARPHRGRGGTPALPARLRVKPLPATALGTLDAGGLATQASLDRTIEFGLLLIEAIDAALDGALTPTGPNAPAATPA